MQLIFIVTERKGERERGRKERERGKGGGREQRHTCTRDLTTCSLQLCIYPCLVIGVYIGEMFLNA